MPTFTPAAGVRVYFQERQFLLYAAYDDNRWLAIEDLAFPMGAGMVLLNISDMSTTPPNDTSAAPPQGAGDGSSVTSGDADPDAGPRAKSATTTQASKK